jgi:hypothetical protein
LGGEGTKGRKLLNILDAIYQRFSQAWASFKNPRRTIAEYNSGLESGINIGLSRANAVLSQHDPHQFSNNHFRLGYYYAQEQVKGVSVGNDNRLA